MRFTSEASSDGVCEQLFTLGEIPGVLWTPEGAVGTRPLIVMGHGGGEHSRAPGILARARRFATEEQARVEAGEELAPLLAGFQALVVRPTVTEWQAVLIPPEGEPLVRGGGAE